MNCLPKVRLQALFPHSGKKLSLATLGEQFFALKGLRCDTTSTQESLVNASSLTAGYQLTVEKNGDVQSADTLHILLNREMSALPS